MIIIERGAYSILTPFTETVGWQKEGDALLI